MKSRTKTALITSILFLFYILSISPVNASTPRQTDGVDTEVMDLLSELTPKERVGQVFLVTFQGTDVGPDTTIYDLIVNHHIGGLVLLAENNNFTTSSYNLNDLYGLINQLQLVKYTNSRISRENQTGENSATNPYIPLFIGTSQEGGGYPNDQIINGLTKLPSQLSIGATWNPDLAFRVGEISGKELSDIGFNLIFGPSLDVLENPLLQAASQLGTRSFGGDPYWVGEMGRAYIRGLHIGSSGKLAVVGIHFPGLGSADRVPVEEVATVRKSLEQLKQIELAPFFTVTGNVITDTEKVDALLTSHIRYQGLQGNIRSTTRPVGFDQQALNLLMELPPFSSWREDGGVMISDDLGKRAVRRFYDPTEQEFNARRLALDAFLAGNDMLYVNNFIEADDPDSYSTILRTLDFFTQKYNEDPLFAERIDQSVYRILSLKKNLYNEFDLDQVVKPPNYKDIGTSTQVSYDVAQQGVTVISPSLEEFDAVLPEIPGRNEFITFITDDTYVQQCDDCSEQPILAVDALAKAVMRLYGPQAGGLVSQYYLRSFSFTQLVSLLDNEGDNTTFLNDLGRSNWVVFLMQDITEQRPASIALKRFLSERPDLIGNKKIIVFATNSPNYLDSTDIYKLNAYIGLLSNIPPFVDIAARILFKEITRPSGSLPISVPGVGYDLILATSPESDQNIPLILDVPEWTLLGEVPTDEDLPITGYRIGDSIPLKTGIIIDTNSHPVPNNTPVQIIITIEGEPAPGISLTTYDGYIQTNYIVNQPGTMSIQVQSGLATSNTLIFEIPEEDITPEPSPTSTPTETPTIEPSPTISPPTPTIPPELDQDEKTLGLGNWLSAVAVAALVSWGASRTGALIGKVVWGVRWGLAGFISGLVVYTYLALGLPGSEFLDYVSNPWIIIIATLIGALFGWLISFGIMLINKPRRETDR